MLCYKMSVFYEDVLHFLKNHSFIYSFTSFLKPVLWANGKFTPQSPNYWRLDFFLICVFVEYVLFVIISITMYKDVKYVFDVYIEILVLFLLLKARFIIHITTHVQWWIYFLIFDICCQVNLTCKFSFSSTSWSYNVAMYMLRMYDVLFHRENSFIIVFIINYCVTSCYMANWLYFIRKYWVP